MWKSPRPIYPNELYHYGVKGMHWGIRRYQPYPKGYYGKGKYLGKIQGIDNESDNKARRKKIVRNIAIGAGVGLAAGGLGYLAYRNRKKAKMPNATRKLSIRYEMWTENGVRRRRRWRLGRI